MLLSVLPASLLAIAVSFLCRSTLLGYFSSDPSVSLDYGTFMGAQIGGIEQFLGIPFAAPPSVSYILSGIYFHLIAYITASDLFALLRPNLLSADRAFSTRKNTAQDASNRT